MKSTTLTEKFRIAISVLTERGHMSRKHMVAAGLKDGDLSRMKEAGLLRSPDRGEYEVADMDALYTRAEELFAMGEANKAYVCYKICFNANTKDPALAKKAFLADTHKKDFKNLESQLDAMLSSEDPQEQSNTNLYLCMLNFLCVTPEKYINQGLDIDELEPLPLESSVKPKNMTDLKSFLNAFKTQDYQSALSLAIKLDNDNPLTVDTLIIKYLARSMNDHNQSFLKTVGNCTKERAFDQILLLLQKENYYHELKTSMILLKMIVTDIVDMKRTGTPLEPQNCQSTKQYDLVYNRQYDEMLKKHLIFLQRKRIKPETNPLAVALQEAISIRDELLNRKRIPKKENQAVPVDRGQPAVVTFKPAPKGHDPLANMLEALRNKEDSSAQHYLDLYLETHHLERYAYLIKGLIKIDQIEEDTGFVKPMVTIARIAQGNFQVDTANFLESIEYRLENDYLETARIYLNLLATASENGDTDVEPRELVEPLTVLENRIAIREFKASKRKKGAKKIVIRENSIQ